MENLADVLTHYGVKGEVVAMHRGPLVKQIEFKPVAGTKIRNITGSLDDIARELGISSLRVEPVDGTNNLGFEVPEEQLQTIDFKTILDSQAFQTAKGELSLCLGVDIQGKAVFADLAKMPHLLVAGTTGSGKSVGLNTFVLSLIKKKTPEELKLVMIDPKRIEFSVYNNQKYMLYPVVTDNQLALETLLELVDEMERRYSLFEESLSKNIAEFNKRGGKLPYIVCVIDEFADLVAADKKAGEAIQRLAQKARASGIHIILATQRPSVDVVTGVLKANFPTRLAYKVASSADSRTILDMPGAENLLGRGDALFLAANGELKRVHGAYMPDDEIAALLEPYRGEVKPLVRREAAEAPTEAKSRNGIFRTLFEFWSSLRQREKKTIISGVLTFLGFITGRSGAIKRKK